ncbi:pirin family protein [Fodinibius salsisoli]|uniref:Pirin family protein n=1 Tax=Fodinibius salsisoli TaxID=2820877 RepID=A0ABT3PRI9_9BACT|nr:pirin family protein [Fodinibius salsisoli]MCW9708477.1 pirin family protein [Fodinibius salsisoli]
MENHNIRLRRSEERGFEDFGWTDNWMTFSFANYHNPEWMRFGPIRVIVENHIQPHEGFDTHPHKDMEILTYVSSGVLTHGDNMGNTEEIGAGEMQRLTAGTGIVHSEKNEHAEVEHNIQIWILPDKAGLEPGYQMKRFSEEQRTDRLCHYVSQSGRNESMSINQDVDIYAGILPEGTQTIHLLEEGRGAWIQLIHGSLRLNEGIRLEQGDGIGVEKEGKLRLEALDDGTELILFDVTMDFVTPYRLG